jgi:hypothetical protein
MKNGAVSKSCAFYGRQHTRVTQTTLLNSLTQHMFSLNVNEKLALSLPYEKTVQFIFV